MTETELTRISQNVTVTLPMGNERAEPSWASEERTRAQAALRASEARYHTLFNSIDEGFCIIEMIFNDAGQPTDYRFLETNTIFEQQTGLSQVAGKTVQELVPDLEKFWIETYGRVALTGESVRFEHHAAPMQRWFNVYATRIGDTNSRLVALVFRDITAQVRRTANLAFLAEMQDDLARLSEAAEIMQTVSAKIRDFLQATASLFAEIDESQDKVIVGHSWHGADTRDLTGVYRLSEYVTEEFRHAARAGQTIVVQNTQTDPRTDAAGYAAYDIHSFVTVPFHRQGVWKYLFTINSSVARVWREDEIELIREITSRLFPRLERARAEKALRESEIRFRSVFASNMVAMGVWAKNGSILDANDALLNLIGYTRDELTAGAIKWNALTPPEHDYLDVRALAEITAQGVCTPFEKEYLHKSGRRIPVVIGAGHFGGDSDTGIFFALDLTERKQAEAKLRAKDELLTRLTQVTPTMLVRCSLDMRYLFVNRAAADLLGLPPEKIIGKPIAEVMGAAAFATIRPYIVEVLQGRRVEYEIEIPYAHAGKRFMHVVYDPEFDESREIIGWIATVTDITERKQAEQALAESEERFSKAFNASPLALTISSLTDGRLVAVNETFVTVSGHPRAAALGKTTLELGLWKRPAERAAELETVRQIGQLSQAEYTFCTRNGTELVGLLAAEKIEIGGAPFALTVIQDITERKKAEQALRESEARLKLATEIGDYGTWDLDYQAGTLIWSDKLFSIFGLQPTADGRITLRELDAMIYPEDLAKVTKLGRLAREQQQSFSAEYRILRADTRAIRWLSSRAQFFYDATGTATRCVGIVQDITARRTAEEKLRRSEEFHSVISEISTDWAFSARIEPDGTVVTDAITGGFTKQLGYTLEELMACGGWEIIVHPDDAPVAARQMEKLLAGETIRGELRHVAKDGHIIISEYQTTPITDETGRVVRLYGATRDITAQKLSAQAIHESEERLRLATDAADMFAWEIDVQTGATKWSDNAAKVIGCAPNQLSNHRDNGNFFVLPEDRQRISHEFEEILAAGKTRYIFEFRGNEPGDAQKCWQAQGLIIYDAAQKPLRVLGVTQNVTARKRAEKEREQLLAREQDLRWQAEEANRLKDEFLATVSHELRTPLNAILGWATMSRKQNYATPIMIRAMEVIERSARNQSQIISDILDVSRIITGKLHLNLQPVRLSLIIQAAIDTVRPSLEAKQLYLVTDFAPETDITMLGDINRLQQIVWNLLANAVKFTPENGTVQVALTYRNNFAQLVVTDNGSGIEPEFLPFVFDRFRQADGKKNRKHGGLGLGLAVVRHLTELHGGSVAVTSPGLGQGAAFTIRLPLVPQSAPDGNAAQRHTPSEIADAGPQQESGVLENRYILVVDDEADALELTAFILARHGAQVTTAASVDEALAIFDRAAPDVIISDIGMPTKDGYELMRELQTRLQQRNLALPVIALTAYAGATDTQEILAAGYQACLPKPIEPANLIATIVACL